MKQQLIFVVGCPRSGTTWLQLLLSQHPAIATLQESHIFRDYLSPAFNQWRRDKQEKREEGLTSLMDWPAFIELWRQFAEQVLRVALQDKPDATFILEKTPDHLYYGREILELFPDAYFVHIIRDPRAVVASLLDAGRSWAKQWAPRTSLPAAEMWRRAISQGRILGALTKRYTEVSYEQLLANPEIELGRVIELIGLRPDPIFCRRAADVCAASNLSGANWNGWAPKSMIKVRGSTVRKGQAASWRTELTRTQVATVEFVTRDLLPIYGYVPEMKCGPLLATQLKLKRSLRESVSRARRILYAGSRWMVRAMRIQWQRLC